MMNSDIKNDYNLQKNLQINKKTQMKDTSTTLMYEKNIYQMSKNEIEKINIDHLNSALNLELNAKLQNIEVINQELDDEIRKRESFIDFDIETTQNYDPKEDQMIIYNNFSNELVEKNEVSKYKHIKNQLSCSTINEENDDELTEIIDLFNENNKNLYCSDDRLKANVNNLNNVMEVLKEEEEEEEEEDDDDEDENNSNFNYYEKSKLSVDDKYKNLDKDKNYTKVDSSQIEIKNTNRQLSEIPNKRRVEKNVESIEKNELCSDSSICGGEEYILNSSQRSSLSVCTSTEASSVGTLNGRCSVLSLNQSGVSNVVANNIVKKGVLTVYQQSKLCLQMISSTTNKLKNNAKRIFFSIGSGKERRWKARFFMLTENYFACFKRGSKSDFLSSEMGKYLFKLNLTEDVKSMQLSVATIHGKPHCININEGAMFLFDKDLNVLKDWLQTLNEARERCLTAKQQQALEFEQQKLAEEQKLQKARKEHNKIEIAKRHEDINNQIDRISQLGTSDRSDSAQTDDEQTLEHLKSLNMPLPLDDLSRSIAQLNTNISNTKTATPIISNRKRMSLQRKSLLSQFDAFLSSPLGKSSNQNTGNIKEAKASLACLANQLQSNNVVADPTQDSEESWCLENGGESPAILPRIAPQCQAIGSTGLQAINKNNLISVNCKQPLTNSCSAFHFGTNPRSLPFTPFTLSNSPALTQRSLYAEQILSNSSMTLSSFSKFATARSASGHNGSGSSSGGSGFSTSTFMKPFHALHYATSLRNGSMFGNSGNNCQSQKSHLKSATSEFSFIRLSNSPTLSTLSRDKSGSGTLRKTGSRQNITVLGNFSNCVEEDEDNDTDSNLNNSYGDTLRNSKTTCNLNGVIKDHRTLILSSSSLLGTNSPDLDQKKETFKNPCLLNKKINNLSRSPVNESHRKCLNENLKNYESPKSSIANNKSTAKNGSSNSKGNKMQTNLSRIGITKTCNNNQKFTKKINNSLDESDSPLPSCSSNSSSCSSNNFIITSQHKQYSNFSSSCSNSTQGVFNNVIYNPMASSAINANDSQSDLSDQPPPPRNRHSANTKQTTLLNVTNSVTSNSTKQKGNRSSRNSTAGGFTPSSNKNSIKLSRGGNSTNSDGKSIKKKSSSNIPISRSSNVCSSNNSSNYSTNTSVSTEKRKLRMNKILENQSKIYVTAADLK